MFPGAAAGGDGGYRRRRSHHHQRFRVSFLLFYVNVGKVLFVNGIHAFVQLLLLL